MMFEVMRRRRFFLITTIPVVVVLLTLATLPWWLGLALGWGGPRWLGVTFENYERIGYGRFALNAVELRHTGVVVSVARIEADTPLFWWGARLRGSAPGELALGAWSVHALNEEPVNRKADESAELGWVTLKQTIEGVADALIDWVPVARIGAGAVYWDQQHIEVGPAQWAEGRLQVAQVAWREQSAMGVGLLRDRQGLRLTAEGGQQSWTIDGLMRDARVSIHGTFWQQAWSLEAVFGSEGWRPEQASLQASDWVLPGELVGGEKLYAELSGEAKATWAQAALTFSVNVMGKPLGTAPPLQVTMRGGGDDVELKLEQLTVKIPGLSASLDQPVRLTTQGELLSKASKFTLSANLSQWPELAARGEVSGVLTVEPGNEMWPKVSGKLAARGVELSGWTINEIGLQAGLQWPELVVSSAQIKLPGGEGLKASGTWNLATQTLADGKVAGTLTAVTLGEWVPATMVFKEVEWSATAEGQWPELTHAGALRVSELRTDWLRPVNVNGTWGGQGQVIDDVALVVQAGEAALQVAGALDRARATVKQLTVEQGSTVLWTLRQPAVISWQPELSIADVLLEGTAGRLQMKLEHKQLELTAAGVTPGWLRPWLVKTGPDWKLETLVVKAGWVEQVLVGTVEGRAQLPLSGEREAAVELLAAADENGIQMQTMRVSSGGQQVVAAAGRLPLVVYPFGVEKWSVLPESVLAFSARTEPQAKFWTWLAEMSGVVVVDPQLDVELSGSWRKPTGRVELTVGRIAADKERWPQMLPEVEGVRAELTVDADGVWLKELALHVAGQQLTAEGRLPVAPSEWGQLWAEPSQLATVGGTLRIRIPNAEVAALARFLPEYLAPTGHLQLDMALLADGGWTGFVRLQDAASRPLGPLGVLGDVNADMELVGRSVKLTEVSAFIGGQPVKLAGTVDFKDWRKPAPELRLKGENLPLVRQSGVLVRADLDLQTHTDAAGQVVVSGVTTLRDSLLLADLRSLLPKGGRGGPMRRPPYFSVETLPLSTWKLEVALHGEHFLKLRTPLFNGMISARFQLGGTLGEPRLLGEALIEEGTVRLPFASFVVEQGVIRISEANPDEPWISLAATARRYGYNLRMELSGPASAPELTFSSSPPLTSEQVLLMVMAGETPDNEMNYTTGQRAVRVGAYLGQSLLGTFGLDPSEADRLTVTIGERISRQGRETYDVSYKLSDRWTLTGEYNEFDDYNVGMKWRFYTSKPEQKKETDEQPK